MKKKRDIIKQRQYRRNWDKKHPEKKRTYINIAKMAIRANPIQQECTILGCDKLGERHHPDYSKPKEIVWLCKAHHEKEHHKVIRLCEIEGCGKKHEARGKCANHLKQWYKRQRLHT